MILNLSYACTIEHEHLDAGDSGKATGIANANSTTACKLNYNSTRTLVGRIPNSRRWVVTPVAEPATRRGLTDQNVAYEVNIWNTPRLCYYDVTIKKCR